MPKVPQIRGCRPNPVHSSRRNFTALRSGAAALSIPVNPARPGLWTLPVLQQRPDSSVDFPLHIGEALPCQGGGLFVFAEMSGVGLDCAALLIQRLAGSAGRQQRF